MVFQISFMFFQFFAFSFFRFVQADVFPVGMPSPRCSMPKSRGIACAPGSSGNTSGVKWYFDKEFFECFALQYLGCGGTGNRFESFFECRKEFCPPLVDGSHCTYGQPNLFLPEGSQCSQKSHTAEEKCPPGTECEHSGFTGRSACCDVKKKEVYVRNFDPKTCANGKTPILIDPEKSWSTLLLGKSCQDQFCPANSECVQQEILAHCCPTCDPEDVECNKRKEKSTIIPLTFNPTTNTTISSVLNTSGLISPCLWLTFLGIGAWLIG